MTAIFKRFATAALALLGLAVTGQASATTALPAPAIVLASPGTEFASGLTLGFKFSVLQDGFGVTSLGVYDSGRDGLAGAAQVGIWDSVGSLKVSATIPAGTAGNLNGYFRYVGVSPSFRLLAGASYFIGAHYSAADKASSVNTGQGGGAGTVNSSLHLIQTEYTATSGFAFPGVTDIGGGAYLGPNFLLAPVPEPDSYAMFAVGLLAVTAAARRRRQPA